MNFAEPLTLRTLLAAGDDERSEGSAGYPRKARHAVVELLQGPLTENPQRVAKRRELDGKHSGRRGKYRVS